MLQSHQVQQFKVFKVAFKKVTYSRTKQPLFKENLLFFEMGKNPLFSCSKMNQNIFCTTCTKNNAI